MFGIKNENMWVLILQIYLLVEITIIQSLTYVLFPAILRSYKKILKLTWFINAKELKLELTTFRHLHNNSRRSLWTNQLIKYLE